MPYILVIGGLLALGIGGEAVVRSAVSLSHHLRVSRLLVGLLVVAVGTSSPELAVSLDAIVQGKADLAVGNVVGSNISNLLLVLAVGALVHPITCYRHVLQRDLVVMLASTGLLMWIATRGIIGSVQGGFLLGVLALYVAYAFVSEKLAGAPVGTLRHNLDKQQAIERPPSLRGSVFALIWLAIGGGALYLGATWLIDGAVELAVLFGVSQAVIALSIIAAGTSLPELATVIVASWRGHPEIVVGGIIGSNIFNILFVLGTTAVTAPVIINPEIANFDMWIMLAATLMIIPFMLSGWRLSRIEGLILLLGYGAYLSLLYGQRGHAF